MSCSIRRNEDNKITGVLAPNGKVSNLFKKIHGNVFLSSPELSLKIYLNSFTGKGEYEVDENKEPKLFYQSQNGKVLETLEETIIESPSGKISMGFKSGNTFQQIASFDTSRTPEAKFLYDQIKEGFLSDTRLLDSKTGETTYRGKGEFASQRRTLAKAVKYNLASDLGIGNVKTDYVGNISFEFKNNDLTVVEDVLGESRIINKNDIPQVLKESNPVNKVDLLLQYLKQKVTSSPKQQKTRTFNDENLKRNLLNFLKGLGFTTTTLDNYQRNYQTRYGEKPGINALADIANKVVALTDENNLEHLSEEVAHIAIEAFEDQNSILGLLANVHLLPEYNEYSTEYRSRYSEFAEGVELEDWVRKEILGKALARMIQNNFSEPAVSETQDDLISKLKNLWNSFTEFIKSSIRPSTRKTLENVLEQIAKNVTENNDVFNNDLTQNKNFFYSLMSSGSKSIEDNLKASKAALEGLFEKALNTSSKNRLALLTKIQDGMDEASIFSSINTIVGITEQQTKELGIALKEANDKKLPVSNDEVNRYSVLSNNLEPQLIKIKNQLKPFTPSPEREALKKTILTNIEKITNALAEAKVAIGEDSIELTKKMYMESTKVSGLSEQEREEMADKITAARADTNFFGKNFGLATHSKNPLINLIASKIDTIQSAVIRGVKKIIDPVVSRIYSKGLDKYQQDIISEKSFYYDGFHREQDYWDDHAKKTLEIISALTGTDIKDLEKSKKRPEDSLTQTQQKQLQDELTKWNKEEGLEQRKNPEYYKQQQKKYDELKTSQSSRDFLSDLNSQQYEIDKKHEVDGKIDRSDYSEEDKERTKDLKRLKAKAKSIMNDEGGIKEGLTFKKYTELTQEELAKLPFSLESYSGDVIFLEDGFTIDSLPEQSRLCYDLNNLTMYYLQTIEEKGKGTRVIDDFKAEIERIEGNGDSAYRWVLDNGSLMLNQEAFQEAQNPNAELRANIEAIEDLVERENHLKLLEEVIQLQKRRSEILKENRSSEVGFETDVDGMGITHRYTVVALDETIEDINKTLSKFRSPRAEQEESELERQPTTQFKKLLEASGKSTYKFVLHHLTKDHTADTPSRKVVTLDKFVSQVTSFFSGYTTLSKSQKAFYDELKAKKILDDTMSLEQQRDIMIEEYSLKQLPSYFVTFAPKGFQAARKAMEDGTISMNDVISKPQSLLAAYPALKFVDINPDYSWGEDLSSQEFDNPNYIPGGHYLKPRMDKYLNIKGFFEKYGIPVSEFFRLRSYNLEDYTPSKNQEQYELLKEMVKLREQVLENYGMTEQVSKFLRPQISTTNLEKLTDVKRVFSKDHWRDMLEDVLHDRIDEKTLGEQLDGTSAQTFNIRLIPKYFLSKVESPEVLSKNVISSAILDLQQSIKYNERKKTEKDISAVMLTLKNQEFETQDGARGRTVIGKKGELSNYYEKAKELTDHQLYGINQNGSLITNVGGRVVDVSRIVNKVQGLVRHSNLAFNPFVDLTSATTGIMNNVIDKIAGDFYSGSSSKRALSQLKQMMPNFIGQAGMVNKSSELNQLLEFFGVEDISSKVKNSAFSRGVRLMDKSPYLLSKLCNMPVTPKAFLSILNDHRFYEGEFRSFNQFYAYMRNTNKSMDRKVIEARWNEIEKDSLYDNLEIKKDGIRYNDKFLAKYNSKTEADSNFEEVHGRVSAMARQVIEGVDGVVSETDQVAAQRNFLLNLMMMHRGWFLLFLTRRFKSSHYNISTGQTEEGHFVTLFKFLKDVAKGTATREGFNNYLDTLSPAERRNIRRAGVETSLFAMLQLFGVLLFAADDDDDTYIEDLSQLIYLRTVSEFNTQQLVNVPNSILETAKSPFVAINSLEALEPVSALRNVFNEDSEGSNKFIKTAIKVSPLRRINQLNDIQGTADKFMYFNNNTLFWVGK